MEPEVGAGRDETGDIHGLTALYLLCIQKKKEKLDKDFSEF